MTSPSCERIPMGVLTDYAAGELSEPESSAVEEHIFSCTECGERAAQLEAIARATRLAMRAAEVDGFVTDAILNRLSREGVRVRSYVLSPGAVVPCAVWDDDEVTVLRLRGDLGSATEFTLVRRVAGTEVGRATVAIAAPYGEVLYVDSAARIRQLPVTEVELLLTAHEGGQDRFVGHYTLQHHGSHGR